ncbi:hypothetical protein [Jeotgalibacillus soli]|uniref:Uncharacterized protein n=1 Tax=Jeotgalibacillus soli TaxID=889306 RepID=A0A0C2VKD2_9BACL|nr:hypothetical protein [Jeotgalibacillus soli]KIL49362.1 hypothetical protein KP78_08300 [Jeotgalibacillus soli]
MIIIEKPEFTISGTKARLQCQFKIRDHIDNLWYEVNEPYQDYLTVERADAFLVGLLPLALKEGYDIKVNYYLSNRLYYTLNKYLIPILAESFGYRKINIHCSNLISSPLKNENEIGTGLSCGIDSFSTIYDHMDDHCPEEYKISLLTFFNVGSHGSNGGEKAIKLFNKRLTTVKKCAEELDFNLLILDSNISEILNMNFQSTHTLRSISAVLALQKLFRVYYYSSAVHLQNFKLDQNIGYYDTFTLNMLSTETISFFSSCSSLTRVEKTHMISKYALVQRYLNVCVKDGFNCGKCFKCLRTLLTLEIIGELEKYKTIFNMDEYFKVKSQFIADIFANRKTDIFVKEIYEEMIRKNTIYLQS